MHRDARYVGRARELAGATAHLSINPWPAPGDYPAGGYWVVLIGIVMAVVSFTITQRGARRFLTWVRERRVRTFLSRL